MEKFAVDLEKVLNDFEYSEEQLSEYSNEQRTTNNSYNCNYKIYQHHYRTPASNYRRPPFEPVNLADADFSVSPRPPPKQVPQNYSIPNNFPGSVALNYDSNSRFENGTSLMQTLTKTKEEPLEYSLFPVAKSNAEFKPDLIESNSDINSNLSEFNRIERHLPDIASTDVETKEGPQNFDLIINSVQSARHEETVEPRNQKMIQFKIDNDVPDEELQQYLEELERENSVESKLKTSEDSVHDVDRTFMSYEGIRCNVGDQIETRNCDFTDENTHQSDTTTVLVSCNENSESTYSNEVINNKITIKVNAMDTAKTNTQINEESEIESKLQKVNFNELNYRLVCTDEEDEESNDRHVEEVSQNVNNSSAPVSDMCVDSPQIDTKPTCSHNVDMHDVAADTVDKIVDEIKTAAYNADESIVAQTVVENRCTNVCSSDNNDEPVREVLENESSSDVPRVSELLSTCERILDNEEVDAVTDSVEYDRSSRTEKECDSNSSGRDETSIEKKKVEKGGKASATIDENSVTTEKSRTTIDEITVASDNDSRIQTTVTVSEQRANQNENTFGHVEDLNVQSLDSKTAISNLESAVDGSSKFNKNSNSDRISVGDSAEEYTDEEEAIATMNDTAEETQPKPQRPSSLNLTNTTQNAEVSSTSADSGSLLSADEQKLSKEAPFWMPDSETAVCMHCESKFTIVRRRHHCRACGLVLCGKCCDMKAKLEYLNFEEVRICRNCHSILERTNALEAPGVSSAKKSISNPNPNNPMEYCSKIPIWKQIDQPQQPPPTVLVPVVGVLKREGEWCIKVSAKSGGKQPVAKIPQGDKTHVQNRRVKTNDIPKQVIFSDGIRPGGDLTELDVQSEPRLPLRRPTRITRRVGTPPGNTPIQSRIMNPETRSFIPSNSDLPPLVTKQQGEYIFSELEKPLNEDDEPVKFGVNRNLFVIVKRITLDCCVNRSVWCMTTEGLACVGQDEIVFILEVLPDEKYPPKDVFVTVNLLFQEASKGSIVTEMSFAAPCLNQIFGSKDYGGFVFIRPTYQCIQKLVLPKPPYLIALFIHRWEAPWARLFPIRLVLRLGAEFRYYPCPLVSIRDRPAIFTEIGHTIISLLADFRKYSYSLPTVRGLAIHMEDKLTSILLPRNRYDQVIRALNNSEENVLAFAGNISTIADSHLVCIQSTQDDTSYHTQAINIHNKPRQVTGASFIVFNGSLKQCGWSGKSNIVEDGLMVQIPSESMVALRNALRHMKDYSIGCGPQAEEMVVLKWSSDDNNFNIGVKSNIDDKPLDGVPSIRVHNGTDYSGLLRIIRWTEVFIIQSDEETGNKTGDTVNISKLSESIARATCVALVPLLDLLAVANLTTLAVRATIHPENVGYEAGSKGEKLPPLYMKSLDEQLIAVVHEAAVNIRDVSCPVILELIFKIMEQG